MERENCSFEEASNHTFLDMGRYLQAIRSSRSNIVSHRIYHLAVPYSNGCHRARNCLFLHLSSCTTLDSLGLANLASFWGIDCCHFDNDVRHVWGDFQVA